MRQAIGTFWQRGLASIGLSYRTLPSWSSGMGSLTGVRKLLDALEHAGYRPQLVVEELLVIDVAQLAVALRRRGGNVWDAVDICPWTTRSEGARPCTYARWFRRPAWRASSVLQLPRIQGSMQRVLRFRTGCHGLPRDVGGHQGVPRRQSICPLCAGGLGDEIHLVFECTALQDIWVSLAPLFERATFMQQFMWQPDLMRVVQFLEAGVRRLQENDPSHAADI